MGGTPIFGVAVDGLEVAFAFDFSFIRWAIDYVLVLIPRDGIGCGQDKVRTGEVLGAARAFIIYVFKRVEGD